MLVRTGMFHFEVSRTALYPLAYAPAHTGTYHLVLPYTRGTGFQMFACATRGMDGAQRGPARYYVRDRIRQSEKAAGRLGCGD